MQTSYWRNGDIAPDAPQFAEVARLSNLRRTLDEYTRVLQEHGVFTLALLCNYRTGFRKQHFASLNAVSNDVAKMVCLHWLCRKYGDGVITFAQSKTETQLSDVRMTYFHASLMVELVCERD